MSKKFNYINNLYSGILFILLANFCFAKAPAELNQNSKLSDTLTIPEISLDSARFYISEDLSKAENTIKDTTLIMVEGKPYKLAYKITSSTSVIYSGTGKYYRLTGLSLGQEVELDNYIKELFKNPRQKLKDEIPAKQWKNSSVYLRYFEPYDKNSLNRTSNKEVKSEDESNELKDFLSDEVDVYVEQNYENFPLPETIDIEVDMRKSPRVVTILDLEFDFDKLDKGFQRLLLDYEKGNRNRVKKSNSQKKN